MNRAFRLGLDALQRDAPGSRHANDGEPILIAIGFHGTFGTGDPPGVWRLPLAGAARPGGAVGTFTFPNGSAAAGEGVQIMGAAVIAVAHDSTPLTIVAAETDAAVTNLREQLAPLLRHASPAFWNLADGQARIAAAAGVVRDTVTFGLLRRLGGFAASIGDPDDQFDAQFLYYTNLSLQPGPGISALRTGECAASFGGPFAGYRLTARLDEIPAG